MAVLEPIPSEAMENRAGGTTRRLLARIRAGDSEARNALCERYLDPLRRWARGRLPAGARGLLDTDDVVQETLVKSLGRVESFVHRRQGAFESYLRRGVLNRIRDEVRRLDRRPVEVRTAGGIADPGPSAIEQALGRENLQAYERALQALSPRDREAILARIELNLSYDEIASLLGRPSADAARMAVSRAILRLAHAMKEC